MKMTTKDMLNIIGEQMARIIELNEYLDKADLVIGVKATAEDSKRKKR